MIHVTIVTGFLGSGKTTLIRRILGDPSFRKTAVIVNEFGEIALDHALIASSDETVLTLSTGCLCCAIQTDLARTLLALADRRETGSIDYDRVLIETSGLGDPGLMLQAMMNDNRVMATHQIASVVSLVDPVLGQVTLQEHDEARRQVAIADTILFTKPDIQPPDQLLIDIVKSFNPTSDRLTTENIDAARIFTGGSPDAILRRVRALPARTAPDHGNIKTITLERQNALPAVALTMLLQALADHCGARLLRLKGLVSIDEMPGRPAEIHGVRHMISQPVFLDRWPTDDRSTRIVCITLGVPRYFIARLLDAIEVEVREASGFST